MIYVMRARVMWSNPNLNRISQCLLAFNCFFLGISCEIGVFPKLRTLATGRCRRERFWRGWGSIIGVGQSCCSDCT